MKKGILICGHGSRDKEGVDGFKELVHHLQIRYPEYMVDYGFLEFAHPVYAAAVERLYVAGVREIIAVPAILFAGGHAKNDIPFEINTLQSQYKDLKITLTRHLGVSSFLLELGAKLINETEQKLSFQERSATCLLVIGRGTADPDANSDVVKFTRMLWEGMGFGFATTAFIGVTKPLLKDTLPLVDLLPFNRIIVLPVFLFTGILLKKIFNQVEEYKDKTTKEIVYTSSFEADELLLKTIDERILEAIHGNPNMNCQLCKYRTQIVGFENEVGKEQVGHHLNVKGILFEEDDKVTKEKKLIKGVKRIFGI